MAFFHSCRLPGIPPRRRGSRRATSVFTRTTFTPKSFSTAFLISVRFAFRSTSNAYSLWELARSVFFSVMMGRLIISNMVKALRQLLRRLLADHDIAIFQNIEHV